MPAPIVPEVPFIRGRTLLLPIFGDPIEQVRSPEMVTAELQGRGADAICIPLWIKAADFETSFPAMMKVPNFQGLLITIPFKVPAIRFMDRLGPMAERVGAINAAVRGPDGKWTGEAFDGIGAVEGFRRRGFMFTGKRVMLIGAGGAGASIGLAIAFEKPAAMQLYDIDEKRVKALADKITAIDGSIKVTIGPPVWEGVDYLLNSSPVGMLDDPRMPIATDKLPKELIVFDTIVKPDETKLLKLAEACGCRTVYGREMMGGQISKIVDFFGYPKAK
jgi:shikimate dehydrogenase